MPRIQTLPVRITRPHNPVNLPEEGKTTPWINNNNNRQKVLRLLAKNRNYRALIREQGGRMLHSPAFHRRHPQLNLAKFTSVMKETLDYAFKRDRDTTKWPSVISAKALRNLKHTPGSTMEAYAYANYETICAELWNDVYGLPQIVQVEPLPLKQSC